MSAATQSPVRLVHQARLAQTLTLAWMTVEAVVAILVGILSHSVALVAFGADSVIELLSAATVLRRLGTAPLDERTQSTRERRASRLIGWALYALAAYIVVSSIYALLKGIRPQASAGGLALAVAAVVIMPGLWRWRLGLSEKLHSSALRADAACSAVCLYMSITLLVGLALNHFLQWWWADPGAALAMIWWIRGEAAEALEAARTGKHCDECASGLPGSSSA